MRTDTALNATHLTAIVCEDVTYERFKTLTEKTFYCCHGDTSLPFMCNSVALSNSFWWLNYVIRASAADVTIFSRWSLLSPLRFVFIETVDAALFRSATK